MGVCISHPKATDVRVGGPEQSNRMENLYNLGEPITVYSHRFKTNILSYPVRFINLDTVGRMSDIASEIFDSIVNKICDTANAAQSDIIGITVNHFSLHKPIMLPFKKRSDFKGEMLVNLIETVMQSKEELNFDEEMRIQVIIVHLPQGSGRKKRTEIRYSDYYKTHACKSGCFIKIENADYLCLARAIVTGIARLHKDEKRSYWETIRKGDKSRGTLKKEKAAELMKKAGLAEHTGSCGLEELERLQACVPEYQIKLFNAMKLCIFAGPTLNLDNHIIYLLHHDDHYTVISSMPAFLGRGYYCDTCNKGFSNMEKHRCVVKCSCCYSFGVCKNDETSTYCSDCNRYFPNELCFKKHKNIGPNHRKLTSAICDRIKRCKDCGHLIQKNHKCGYFHCKVCNEDVPEKDHLCFMQPFEPKKECKKFIFFDVETRQENILKEADYGPVFKHEINLAVAQSVCINCINGDQCDGNCGENTFWDRDSFCSWLFADENRGSTCIAHFMKGFDGQFCLQYLHEQGILPKITPKGSELMCIYVKEADIRIIDSINFFNMPLAALPKTFGFDELKKGYFPHFFNRSENFNYIGPIPDAFYYGPANMKPAASEAFYSWHKDQLKIGVVFNFKKELVDYCRSDVDILKRCCLQFRKDFLAENGLDPLIESMTIAGACNRVYRQTFLEEHTIGIVPHGGYRRKDVQSVIALKWLKWVSLKENIEIRHAANTGEVRIGPYKVDGLAGNVIYEFYGCCWHGCIQCFRHNRKQHCADKRLTVEDAYQKVQERKKFLESHGYTLIEKWGCQLDAELKINKEMTEFFSATEIMSPLDPRDAFYGGRTNATKMYHKCKPGEKIHYIDIVSLYPWVNKYGKYVLGHPMIITENFKDLACKPYEGLIKIKILPPRKLQHPLLPCKVQKKLLFSLCKTCAETKQQETCRHSDEERAMTGVWVTDEIYKALSLGYTVLKIYEVWTFENSTQYDAEMEPGLFGGYVNKFLKLKQEADGWPTSAQSEAEKDLYISRYEEREGIRLQKDNISKNPGRRMLSKIMLNSFWGKFGERSNMTQTEYFTEFNDYCKLLMDPTKVVKGVNFVNENMVAVSYCYEDDFAPLMGNTNVILAAYTTCQARLKLYSYIEQLQEKVLYFDTDSIIYVSNGPTIPTGSFLGDMSNELKDYPAGSFISEFVSAGPKNYSYKVCSHDNIHLDTICKVRGFSLSTVVQKRLNFKSMRTLVHSYVKEQCNNELNFVFPKIERYLLNVVTKTVCKKYRVVYDKRVVKNDFTTLPYGY